MTTAPRTADPRLVPADEASAERSRRYHLVLLDDDQHTYAYVIEMLARVFGYGPEKSYALASMVDTTGRAILETADLETVTRHQAGVHGYGADPRIPTSKGSMSAQIEEVS